MLTMPEINCIKLMRNQKSLSINKISKTLGINWRTAKKYADGDQLPEENKKKKSGMMYDEQWGEIQRRYQVPKQFPHNSFKKSKSVLVMKMLRALFVFTGWRGAD